MFHLTSLHPGSASLHPGLFLVRLSEAQAWGDPPQVPLRFTGVTHGATSTRLGWLSGHSGQTGGYLIPTLSESPDRTAKKPAV